MIVKFKNPWTGKDMDGVFKFSQYFVNDRLAIELWAKEHNNDDDYFQPYTPITVNLPAAKMNSHYAVFIDVNNAPWLEGFLQENGFGYPTGRFRTSGFCNYPEYLLNWKSMQLYKLGEKDLVEE